MKKAISALLTAAMVFSLTTAAIPGEEMSAAKAIRSGNGFDYSIANQDRLQDMLRKQGVIAATATSEEAEQAVQNYLHAKALNATKEVGELDKQLKTIQGNVFDKLNPNGLQNGLGLKVGQANKVTVDPVQEQAYNGGVQTDKILALLIEFPDLKHNTVRPEDSDMYYPEYPLEHYQNMMFGKNGYMGPDGEVKVSMKQFYEQQSGGSYTIDGTVVNWSMTKNNAKYYGGNYPTVDGSDRNPRMMVYEALANAAASGAVNFADFDVEDRYDLDGDGNLREPDGILDHVMVIFAGVGEEAGGGQLGSDAVWSHSWNMPGLVTIPGTNMRVYDYTVQPEDGAAGVFAHEFGHDLGLPDEYDTQYSGKGEPVASWSIMSSGSWAGKIPGTEPTGFSPFAKEYLQARYNGNWVSGSTIDFANITTSGTEILLDQANSKGLNNSAVRINLPDVVSAVNTPYSGTYEYFGGRDNNLNNSMNINLDLTQATTAKLNFKAWYQIEQDWDYASVQVRPVGTTTWTAIPGNITTAANPYDQNPGNGITGASAGWVDGMFDLSAYAGQNIELRFNYWTDGYVSEAGFYVDDINVSVNGNTVVSDNAEGNTVFAMNGFKKDLGKTSKSHYYLVEWRNHAGVDKGLANIRVGNSLMRYEPGLVVWYVDESYLESHDNWVGMHPGQGYLGVVDADQNVNTWSDQRVGSTRYQIHDAAFSLQKAEPMFVDYTHYGFYMRDNQVLNTPVFDDSRSYISRFIPDAGRKIPNYGLKIRVVGEAGDRSAAKVLIYR